MSHGLVSGEDCTAGSRVYVQDGVYDEFVALLIEKVKSTPIGDGFDETVTSGPIVREPTGGIHSLIYGVLRIFFGRSQKLNSIRCGATSSPGKRKAPKFWSADKGVRAGAILSIPQVSFRYTRFDNRAYSIGKVFADVQQDMKIVSKETYHFSASADEDHLWSVGNG